MKRIVGRNGKPWFEDEEVPFSGQGCYGLYVIMTCEKLEGYEFTQEEKVAAARDWLRRHSRPSPEFTAWAHFGHSAAVKLAGDLGPAEEPKEEPRHWERLAPIPLGVLFDLLFGDE